MKSTKTRLPRHKALEVLTGAPRLCPGEATSPRRTRRVPLSLKPLTPYPSSPTGQPKQDNPTIGPKSSQTIYKGGGGGSNPSISRSIRNPCVPPSPGRPTLRPHLLPDAQPPAFDLQLPASDLRLPSPTPAAVDSKSKVIIVFVECILGLEKDEIGEFLGNTLLAKVMDLLTDLDVNISWEDILQEDFNKGIFDMELEDMEDNADDATTVCKKSSEEAGVLKGNAFADKLDSLMVVICEHLKSCASDGCLVKQPPLTRCAGYDPPSISLWIVKLVDLISRRVPLPLRLQPPKQATEGCECICRFCVKLLEQELWQRGERIDRGGSG